MKVLIVSFWFPPSNVVGAIRVGKLARYLVRHGHELRVLTTDIAEDRSLPREIPRKYVYSKYRPRKDWLDLLWRYFGRRPESAVAGRAMASPGGGRRLSNPALNWIKRHYYALIHIPDMRRDWIKAVVPAGKRLIEEWKPDIIFGSAPPFTGLIVAGHLARRFNIPWVADFRDLWVGNPYYGFWEPGWRRPVDAIYWSG